DILRLEPRQHQRLTGGIVKNIGRPSVDTIDVFGAAISADLEFGDGDALNAEAPGKLRIPRPQWANDVPRHVGMIALFLIEELAHRFFLGRTPDDATRAARQTLLHALHFLA